MTRDELLDRLEKYEWSDIEFKEAARAAPRSSYETVSAFANTAGGWLVFGVRDHGGSFEIVGVIEVDREPDPGVAFAVGALHEACRAAVLRERDHPPA